MTKPANLANLAKGTSSAADAVGNPSAALAISRRRAALLLASFAAVSVGGRSIARADPVSGGAAVGSIRTIEPDEGPELIREAVAAVLPENGFSSRIALKDSLLRLVAEGVIDPQRFASAYRDRGGIPVELSFRLRWPSHLPIRLTAENAGYYVNLLWPIGLANAIEGNRASPVNGPSLLRFASTAGWTLGQEENGGTYFNRFRIVELTREQEEMAIRVAQNTYRPCCNNSTFFQDCNHGSALFGLARRIDHDHHICARRARRIDRRDVAVAAIDQNLPADPRGRHDSGQCTAGINRPDARSGAEDDAFAGQQVGGANEHRNTARLDRLHTDQPVQQRHAPFDGGLAKAPTEIHLLQGALGHYGLADAGHDPAPGKIRWPRKARNIHGLQGRIPAGVQPIGRGHQCAHRHPDQNRRRVAVAPQGVQHPDMGKTARAATREYNPNFRVAIG